MGKRIFGWVFFVAVIAITALAVNERISRGPDNKPKDAPVFDSVPGNPGDRYGTDHREY